ncbi:MAG: hypothetical protein EOP35_00210 [Rubrivivax sp.]|nr:MAG: hypothetical protein EOP35_00210 [Rubrivivax sp.]
MEKPRFLLRRNAWADDDGEPAPPAAVPAGAPPCRYCTRLRFFLAGALLAAALVMLHASAQGPTTGASGVNPAFATAPTTSPTSAASAAALAHPVPPRLEPQVQTLQPPPPPPAPAASLALVYQTVPLPNGLLGQPYKPRNLVRGGRGPFRFTLDGSLPPGLTLDAEGRLAGTPTATGSHRFELTVTDAANPLIMDRAPYVLRVLEPAEPAPAAKPAKGKPAGRPLTSLTESQAGLTVPADPPLPMTYVLTAAKLAEVVKNAETAAGENQAEPARQTASAGAAPAAWSTKSALMGPTVEQLHEMLQPLQDVEHPTRAVFQDSLRARQCDYFLRHVNAVALEEHRDLLDRCPRSSDLSAKDSSAAQRLGMAASAAVNAANVANAATLAADKKLQAALASGRLPLDVFLETLMPADLREQLTDLAGVTHPIDEARQLQLAPTDGCGCALPDISSDVIAFMPYWLPGADKAPLQVRFDKFTRLQFMGAILRNNGQLLKPIGWDSSGGGFARQVDRHAVNLDLVLYRRDFSVLSQLSRSALDGVLESMAGEVQGMLDQRHGDVQGALDSLLPRRWREATYVYDGLTVFFDPSDEEARSEGFGHFYMSFVLRLVKLMEAQPQRRFHLNLVVPQHLLGDPATAFRFNNLMHLMKSAEKRRSSNGDLDSKDRSAAAATYKSKPDYVGQGDISMRFLAPLGVGSDTAKMQLRARTDFNEELMGEDRMALLGSLVPVLLHAGGPPARLVPDAADALDRDLVYIGWSFGGIAFWPLPVASRGVGADVLDGLDKRFWSYLDQDTAFCKLVCPMRLPFRVALEFLLLATGAALLAYGWNCRVRRLGKLYLTVLWGAGIATLAVTFAVFTCDPSLNALRQGNVPLLVLIVLLVIGGLVLTFRRPVADP